MPKAPVLRAESPGFFCRQLRCGVRPCSLNVTRMPKTTAQFTIDLTPGEPLYEGTGRFDFIKTWTGGLEGTSTGTMLSAGDQAAGMAGYVAIEVFAGALDGREGTFALQQFGTRDADGMALQYVVVPGSGTGELDGLRGTVQLDVVDGVHHVVVEHN